MSFGNIYAQDNEKWITLEEYLEIPLIAKKLETNSEYNHILSTESSSNTELFIYETRPDNDTIWNQVLFKKIGFKIDKEQKFFIPESFFLQTIDLSDLDNPSYGGEVEIKRLNEIKPSNGKKIKIKDLPLDDNGLRVFEFEDLMRLKSIGIPTNYPLHNLPYSHEWLNKRGNYEFGDFRFVPTTLYKNIYVSLPSVLPYYNEIEAFKEDKEEEKFKKEEDYLYSNTYTDARELGWIANSEEILNDGTKVYHYDEGVRLIVKPNGDYASFIERKDERDEKTLNLIPGSSLPLNDWDRMIGAFRLTCPNNILIESDGIYTDIEFPNGDVIFFPDRNPYNFYGTELKNLREKKQNVFLTVLKYRHGGYDSDKNSLNYYDFQNPSKLKNIEINRWERVKAEFIKNNEEEWKTSLLFFNLFEDDNELSKIIHMMDEYGKIYEITDQGLQLSGVFINDEITSDFRNWCLLNGSNNPIVEKSQRHIKFKNGDFINLSQEMKDTYYPHIADAILTLPDGGKMEKMKGDERCRVEHENGDVYAGTFMGGLIDFYNNIVLSGVPNYHTGWLTKADGKEIKYEYGKSDKEREIEKAENDANSEKNRKERQRLEEEFTDELLKLIMQGY